MQVVDDPAPVALGVLDIAKRVELRKEGAVALAVQKGPVEPEQVRVIRAV